jgi:hypothetical protein
MVGRANAESGLAHLGRRRLHCQSGRHWIGYCWRRRRGSSGWSTSGALARRRGIKVKIGLAIASGAAAGGIVGGAGAWGGANYGQLAAFAASPVAGASAAAIRGADPGMGALIAC